MDYEIRTLHLPSGAEEDCLVFGTGKRPFVMIPGMSVRSVMLSAPFVAAAYADFGADWTVYVFDRRKDMPEGFSVADMARDVAEGMDCLGIADADVFGASQGGMIAQILAARRPELVRRMVLGSSFAGRTPTGDEAIAEWNALAAAGDPFALNMAVFARLFSQDYLERYADAIRVMAREGTPAEINRFRILGEACMNFDARAELDKIRCPVMVLGARNDRVLGVEGSLELAERLGCECYIYEDYGHAVYDEAPDYKDRLRAFFKN